MEWYDDPRNKHPMDVESERDALRAEVEVLRRDALSETIDKLICHVPMPYNIQAEIKAWRDRQLRAISEARKGEHESR